MVFAGMTLIFAGVLVAVVGKYAAAGKITRNGMAGIRTKRSMADDESWLIVHRRALPWTYAATAAMIAGGVSVFVIPSEGAAGIAVLIATVICLALMVVGTMDGHRELTRSRLPR